MGGCHLCTRCMETSEVKQHQPGHRRRILSCENQTPLSYNCNSDLTVASTIMVKLPVLLYFLMAITFLLSGPVGNPIWSFIKIACPSKTHISSEGGFIIIPYLVCPFPGFVHRDRNQARKGPLHICAHQLRCSLKLGHVLGSQYSSSLFQEGKKSELLRCLPHCLCCYEVYGFKMDCLLHYLCY